MKGSRRHMELYRHTQVGHVIRVTLGISLIVVGVILGWAASQGQVVGIIATSLALVSVALSLVLFHSLTVSVASDAVALSFGPGLIRKTFAPAEIASCRTVRNPWWYGWGIHL